MERKYEIELKGVSKHYKGRDILQNVNLNILKGQTIGIIGPNGSGKSVLFKLIAGFIRPDNGEVYIRGKRLGKECDFPDNMGVLINKPGYIELYSGLKNLQFLAGIKNVIGNDKIESTMRIVGLNPEDHTKVKNYSMGMKQKLGLAQAIMEEQDIIILDEPFNALDVKSYKDIKETIKQQQNKDCTILLTSHNHDDIEELCEESYIIIDSSLERLTDEIKQEYLQK